MRVGPINFIYLILHSIILRILVLYRTITINSNKFSIWFHSATLEDLELIAILDGYSYNPWMV